MDFESLRTLAKRLQVRLWVLEDVLEETGIMSEEKRMDMYLQKSAAYDQDEAKSLEPLDDEGDDSNSCLDDVQDEVSQAMSVVEWLPIWATCGCNTCHSNIIENLQISDAVEYWEYTHEISVPDSFDTHGAIAYPISEEDYEEWLDCIQHLIPIDLSFNGTSVWRVEDTNAAAQELFGEGVFNVKCSSDVDEKDLAYEALETLMEIIEHPVDRYGGEAGWIKAVQQAAQNLKFK